MTLGDENTIHVSRTNAYSLSSNIVVVSRGISNPLQIFLPTHHQPTRTHDDLDQDKIVIFQALSGWYCIQQAH